MFYAGILTKDSNSGELRRGERRLNLITEVIKRGARQQPNLASDKNRRTVCQSIRARPCLRVGPHPKSVNLYRFIRLILRSRIGVPLQAGGPDVSDTEISSWWRMDQKNFSQFKNGKSPVPRLEKLEKLAQVIGVNKHLVFQVAGGASADKVFNLIKKNDLPGQIKLLFGIRGCQNSESSISPRRVACGDQIPSLWPVGSHREG